MNAKLINEVVATLKRAGRSDLVQAISPRNDARAVRDAANHLNEAIWLLEDMQDPAEERLHAHAVQAIVSARKLVEQMARLYMRAPGR